MSDPEIVEPYGISTTPLIMVISPSPVYRETLTTYLLDFQYRVSGPFESVDSGHAFLRRHKPDLILFDAINSQTELINYLTLLREEADDIPTLVLHNGDGFSVAHSVIDFIYPPIKPSQLEQKIKSLLVDESSITPTQHFVEFINQTISTMIILSPDYAKKDIMEIVKDAILNFTLRNSEITKASEEAIHIQVTDEDAIDLNSLSLNFRLFLEDVIEQIDKILEANWGYSLIEDTLETVTLDMQKLPDHAIDIAENMGKGYDNLIDKFKHAVPDHDDLDKNIITAKLLLTDWGPELMDVFATDPQLETQFNGNIASQLITLVGQGSNYHQGIFGPVPIPGTDDIIAILWSRLLNSDIKDKRMEGRSLVVVAVGFHQSVINLVPLRPELEKIFSILDDVTHEKEITMISLQQLAELFQGSLN